MVKRKGSSIPFPGMKYSEEKGLKEGNKHLGPRDFGRARDVTSASDSGVELSQLSQETQGAYLYQEGTWHVCAEHFGFVPGLPATGWGRCGPCNQ